MRQPKGFTLIELLVVVAIITALIAILLPSLHDAKRVAKSAVCKSNLHQMGVAHSSFYASNRGRFVPYTDPGIWIYPLWDYIGSQGMRLCPEATEKSPSSFTYSWLGSATTAWRYSVLQPNGTTRKASLNSYGYNWYLYDMSGGGYLQTYTAGREYSNFASINEPHAVPIWADSLWEGAAPRHTNTLPAPFDGMTSIIYDRGDSWGMDRYALYRHGKQRSNMVYIDGHAAEISTEQLWQARWHRTFEYQSGVVIPN